MSGVSNDDFLLNTLKTSLGYPEYLYRSVEIHSERRYKICSCLVSLGDFESSKLQRLQYHFHENFRCNFSFYERENFSDSYLNHIFESENFRFLSSTKDGITWGSEMSKIKLQRIVGNLLDKFRQLYMNGTVI